MNTSEISQADVHQGGETRSRKPLRRSRDDRVIAGVCGGVGAYLDIDPILLRIAFAALTLAGGSGVLIYVIAWIAIPEPGAEEASIGVSSSQRRGPVVPLVLGGGLVLAGAALLAEEILPGIGQFFWPLVLIGIGAFVLLRGDQR